MTSSDLFKKSRILAIDFILSVVLCVVDSGLRLCLETEIIHRFLSLNVSDFLPSASDCNLVIGKVDASQAGLRGTPWVSDSCDKNEASRGWTNVGIDAREYQA